MAKEEGHPPACVFQNAITVESMQEWSRKGDIASTAGYTVRSSVEIYRRVANAATIVSRKLRPINNYTHRQTYAEHSRSV